MNNMWILAAADGDVETTKGTALPPAGEETTATETGTIANGTNGLGDDPPQPTKPAWQNPQFIFMGLMLVVMYLFIFRGPKKKQQKHANMVKSLKKNDRIRTIGGIFGTVIEVKDKEVVLKIDETNNTKMRVNPGAIASVITDEND